MDFYDPEPPWIDNVSYIGLKRLHAFCRSRLEEVPLYVEPEIEFRMARLRKVMEGSRPCGKMSGRWEDESEWITPYGD